ncbi:unnamed protein product, partial [Pleuronectes platessa]
ASCDARRKSPHLSSSAHHAPVGWSHQHVRREAQRRHKEEMYNYIEIGFVS